ncbi:hypothetical protein U9M48_035413, partial [Paspalum notatum var. saurae]
MLCLFLCFVGCAEWCGHRWRLRTHIGGCEIMKTRKTTLKPERDQLYSRAKGLDFGIVEFGSFQIPFVGFIHEGKWKEIPLDPLYWDSLIESVAYLLELLQVLVRILVVFSTEWVYGSNPDDSWLQL